MRTPRAYASSSPPLLIELSAIKATMEAINFFHAFEGKRVKVTLKKSSYVGFIQRINSNKSLVFVDVVNEGCKIPGSQLFFSREILNVEIVDGAHTGIGKAKDTSNGPVAPREYMEKIEMVDENEEDSINFIVVDEFQGKFVPAVAHIKRQYAIGVGAEGVQLFKNGRLCWLQIATKNKIYLFDILLLGPRAFKNGLAQILENKHILKIIHNCRVISSCLNSQFGVKLNNVFDTQMADVMCFHSETGGFLPDRVSTLEEVASLHLKIPSAQVSALQMKSKLNQEKMNLWQRRPCPAPLLKLMSLSVTHLMPLRLALMQTLMMDYMTLVDLCLQSSYLEPAEMRALCMESTLELPDELQKLEQMRCERQQWASEHYAVTVRGLLDRFGPRASSEKRLQGDKEAESSQPASTKPPASEKGCPASAHQPVSPQRGTADSSFNNMALPDAVDKSTKPTMAARRDLRSAVSPKPPGGPTKMALQPLPRGKLSGQQQSPAPALSAGRGFLLRMSQVEVARYSSSA